ncbi:hypothetical protein ILUMI_13541, partial [Ignelater luminosus]
MPTGIWTMEGHEKLYLFVMIEQYSVTPFAAVFIWSLDCMYLGFCAETVIQFRILSHYLEENRTDGNTVNEMEISRLNKIKDCVRHHRLILRFVKEFQQAFSLAMAISDALYFSNWYDQHFPSLKVPLLLMIQNSQNEITIKGGGLVTINAGTVVN